VPGFFVNRIVWRALPVVADCPSIDVMTSPHESRLIGGCPATVPAMVTPLEEFALPPTAVVESNSTPKNAVAPMWTRGGGVIANRRGDRQRRVDGIA